MKTSSLSLGLGLLLLLVQSCGNSPEPYAVENHFTATERDTLLVDLITYIYKKPKRADDRTRHEPRYRRYYTAQLPQFAFDRYFVAPDSTHYYYLLRPARHARGNQRGVGGRFRLAAGNRVTDFEEIYNTPVLPEEELRLHGRQVFEEMVEKNGDISRYLGDQEKVEWPDDRLRYDRQRQEWRYDVPL